MIDVQNFRTLLHHPLPGPAAHGIMTPQPSLVGSAPKPRKAAVLLLLSPRNDRPAQTFQDLTITLICRARSTHHSYELAFPGGLRERFESPPTTALREAHEEVGLAADSVRLIGQLSSVRTATSRAVIHPVLALAARRADLHANEEVAAVLQVPLAELRDPQARRVEYQAHPELGRRRIPYFAIGREKLWGASAKIMAELLAVLYGGEFCDGAGHRLSRAAAATTTATRQS